MLSNNDTIAAIATAPGRGGIGILRLSGKQSSSIAKKILHFKPKARYAHFAAFHAQNGEVIDQGIALYFPSPHSFTGEDVFELQGHGGPYLMDMILAEVIKMGARQANPGEFSERAYLNDKLDLAQAEAIADLIGAQSQQAAKQALNSLQGAFSREIQHLLEQLIHLRVYVESAIDFPEEEIDFLGTGKVANDLQELIKQTEQVLKQAQQGVLLREGMKVVIAGRPNAGKSSLLNALAQKDVAIVTPIAGTTRDVLQQHIHIDGMPLHIVDTAGLRQSDDTVEQIGIQRAWQEIDQADRILLIIDTSENEQVHIYSHWPEFLEQPSYRDKLTIVYNKIDLSDFKTPHDTHSHTLSISAKTGKGIDTLKTHLKHMMGYQSTTEGGFSARQRHLQALSKAKASLCRGQQQFIQQEAGELLAEDLRDAQNALGEITGTFTPDDLLGEIFSSFCIGK